MVLDRVGDFVADVGELEQLFARVLILRVLGERAVLDGLVPQVVVEQNAPLLIGTTVTSPA